MTLSLDDFIKDEPKVINSTGPADVSLTAIDGVTVTKLNRHSDHRGSLTELLSMAHNISGPIPHVYRVTALPGSVRAWVYHRDQTDRLAFAAGRFRIVTYDLRPGSSTRDALQTIELGEENPGLLSIAPCVVHGVQNIGTETASFINMPTQVYNSLAPDKWRLPADDPRIPYRFD